MAQIVARADRYRHEAGNLVVHLYRLDDMRRPLLLFAVLALFATSCAEGDIVATSTSSTSSTTIVQSDSAPAELAAARSMWGTAAPADYTVAVSTASGDKSIVAVRDGETITLADGAEPMTVDDVFATIERSIGDGAVVDVEYHPELGYPIRVVIDLDGDGTADIDLTFADLEAMPIVQNLEELQAARRLWDAQALGSYRYIMRADCTCDDGGTWDVEVRNREDVTSRPLDDLAEASSLSMESLNGAFDDLEDWFTDSSQFAEEGLLGVDVRMDPALGYPRWFEVVGEGVDDENFAESFTLTVTIDLVGPIDPAGPLADEADIAALVAAREHWKALRLQDYSFVYTRHCECPQGTGGPVEVVVIGGNFQSATLLADGTPVAREDVPARTVPDFLLKIGFYLNTDKDVEVTYHPVLGFPIDALLDLDAVAVDGGLALAISDLRPTGRIGVIAGMVVAGPQCPVQTDPPAPQCDDQPVGNAPILMGESDWDELIPIPVADDGTFAVRAPAGRYVIRADPLNAYLGTPDSVEFDLAIGQVLDLVLVYDTGIR